MQTVLQETHPINDFVHVVKQGPLVQKLVDRHQQRVEEARGQAAQICG
jgi:hypothetical protein